MHLGRGVSNQKFRIFALTGLNKTGLLSACILLGARGDGFVILSLRLADIWGWTEGALKQLQCITGA
jgi:hypothetical protein